MGTGLGQYARPVYRGVPSPFAQRGLARPLSGVAKIILERRRTVYHGEWYTSKHTIDISRQEKYKKGLLSQRGGRCVVPVHAARGAKRNAQNGKFHVWNGNIGG